MYRKAIPLCTYVPRDAYVHHFYQIKATTSNQVERGLAKSLLNNLLGRFGLNIHKSKTELMNIKKFNVIAQTKEIESVAHIGDMMLVTYNNKVSPEICEGLGLDHKEAVRFNLRQTGERETTFPDVSIAVASAVTAYARIMISKAKLDILTRGGVLYYSDTDSIVTNIPLGDDMVGKKLGQFKLEHMVNRGYFITSKTYCLILESDISIIKAKGAYGHTLNEEDFKILYKGGSVKTVRRETYRDYNRGFVNINIMKPIVLSGEAYTKRTKVFVDDVWVDTKPITYNDKPLVDASSVACEEDDSTTSGV